MFLVKVLEKKSVIRLFGAAFLIAPFVNTLIKLSLLTLVPNPWSLSMFWAVLTAGSITNQILYVATIIIGFLMLRGNAAGWKYALMLLGGYIALQVSNFSHVKSSGITWLFFIINVGAFLFIADQLVWKVKARTPQVKPPVKPSMVNKPVLSLIPNAAVPNVRKKVLFQFAGENPWAQLIAISNQGIHLRGLAEPPIDLATREIEISLHAGLRLRTRLARRAQQDYYFDYTNLTSEHIKSLNQWLHSMS